MLLENVGIRIELTNPIDIAHYLSLGYVEVADPAAEKLAVVETEQPADVKAATKLTKAEKKLAAEQKEAEPGKVEDEVHDGNVDEAGQQKEGEG